MKIRNPIRSFADIEEFLSTMVSRLPAPSKSILNRLLFLLPVIYLAIGSLLIAAAIVPYLGSILPTESLEIIDPLANSGLIMINILLFRFVFFVIGVIFISSFFLLKERKLRGWYNLFYVSIFHIFFVIIIFNIYSLLLLLGSWYVLFNVKKHFS